MEFSGDALSADQMSRSAETIEDYNADPLIYRGDIKARFGEQIMSVIEISWKFH